MEGTEADEPLPWDLSYYFLLFLMDCSALSMGLRCVAKFIPIHWLMQGSYAIRILSCSGITYYVEHFLIKWSRHAYYALKHQVIRYLIE